MISKVFEIIFIDVENFRRKSFYLHMLEKVFEDSLPIVAKLMKINIKKKTKSILTLDFTALYITIPQYLQVESFIWNY